MVKIKSYQLLLASLLTLVGCSDNSPANQSDEVITLRFSHFMNVNDPINKKAFEPWARKVEAESNGRLKVEIFPSATLSKPEGTYDAVAKGIVDIGSMPQGYNSGRFPISQMAELPGVSSSGVELSCVLHTLYDEGVIDQEYDDTHLLYMMGSGTHSIHTVDKPIRTPDDIKGLRIRRTSSVAGDVLEGMGAVPVGIPASDTYTSIQRGVIDGVSLPWQPIKPFHLDELVKAHTNIPFYNAAFVVTMNKKKYDSLPDDLKKVIDDNSGAPMGKQVSELFDTNNKTVMQEAIDNNDTLINITDPLNDPVWKGALNSGINKYMDELERRGIDAQAAYDQVKAASAACQA